MSETAPILATMLAVGIDYALFILTRYRSNLKDGMDGREAAAHATATAGSAVVFAGATVVIALVGLLVVNIPFLTVMGMAAAGTVSIAVLIALTLLPGDLRLRRASPGPRQPRGQLAPAPPPRGRGHHEHPLGEVRDAAPVGRRGGVDRHARRDRRPGHAHGARPAGCRLRPWSTTRQAYDLLEDGFGPGFNGPLTVVVDAPNLPANEQAAWPARSPRA